MIKSQIRFCITANNRPIASWNISSGLYSPVPAGYWLLFFIHQIHFHSGRNARSTDERSTSKAKPDLIVIGAFVRVCHVRPRKFQLLVRPYFLPIPRADHNPLLRGKDIETLPILRESPKSRARAWKILTVNSPVAFSPVMLCFPPPRATSNFISARAAS